MEGSLGKYLASMRRSGTWADAPIISALAKALKRSILVIAFNPGLGDLYEQVYNSEAGTPVIPVFYDGNKHYELVDENWLREQDTGHLVGCDLVKDLVCVFLSLTSST